MDTKPEKDLFNQILDENSLLITKVWVYKILFFMSMIIALILLVFALGGCSQAPSGHTQRTIAKQAMDTGAYMEFWARH